MDAFFWPFLDYFLGFFLEFFLYKSGYIFLRKAVKVVLFGNTDKDVVPLDKGAKTTYSLSNFLAFIFSYWSIGFLLLCYDVLSFFKAY